MEKLISPEILDHLNNGIIIYEVVEGGRDFLIQYMNPAAERLDHIKRDEIIGNSVQALYPMPRELDLRDKLTTVWANGFAEHHLVPRYDGRTLVVWRDFHIFKLSDQLVVMAYDDITDKELAEIKLRTEYERSEFYREMLLHDIRNILQVLFLAAQNGLKKLDDTDFIKQSLELILEQGNKAESLIKNTDRIFNLERPDQELKIIDLTQVLTDAVNNIKRQFPAANLEIDVALPPETLYVKANELLSEVFDNILHNAIKYNDKSPIKIAIHARKEVLQDISYVRIEIMDNGVGISDEHKKSIFQKPHKIDPNHDGMGLGLPIVDRLLRIYKGKVWIQDRIPGDASQGANFMILIPEYVR
ncbi:MAG: PAS domain-containing sensor histidine kinase [Promethearchaeota archaeon]|nr:MAG: PAS domain-containing sensor histidine kinase [Candidatus Lokiarchaeota archaeon]